MKENFIAGVVQLDPREDYEENLQSAEKWIKIGAERGAKLLMLPEVWTYQGPTPIDFAEDIPGGECFAMLSRLAKQYGIWIHGGSITEKIPGDSVKTYNTTMVVNPEGQLAAKYRKIHTFDVDVEGAGSYRESDRKRSGNEIVVCDAKECGKLGLSICYDIRFPEVFRLQAMEGADILCLPAAFLMMTGKDHWEPLIRARAIENGCYVIAPAQCGVKPKFVAYGKSMVVDPWGNIIAKAPEQPGVVMAEIDLDYLEKVRKQVFTLENRRPDVYQLSRIGNQDSRRE